MRHLPPRSFAEEVLESLRSEQIAWSEFVSGASELTPFVAYLGGGGALIPVSVYGVGWDPIAAVNDYAAVGSYVQASSTQTTYVSRLVFQAGGTLHPAVAPSATDDYTVRVGFGSGTGATFDGTESSNACYFRLSYNAGNTNWICVNRAASVESATDSGTAFSSGTQKTLGIVVAPGVAAYYYINGALVATISTNLPSAGIGVIVEAIKTVGSTNRTGMNLDYLYFRSKLVTMR